MSEAGTGAQDWVRISNRGRTVEISIELTVQIGHRRQVVLVDKFDKLNSLSHAHIYLGQSTKAFVFSIKKKGTEAFVVLLQLTSALNIFPLAQKKYFYCCRRQNALLMMTFNKLQFYLFIH